MNHINSEFSLLNTEHPGQKGGFNLKLADLFSDPQADRASAIVVSNGSCPEEGIVAGGLVKIDFTINSINYDGLYVITLNDEWIGFRRFQFMPDLRCITAGLEAAITPEIMQTIKVVGLVKDIYQSTKQH
jgi:hypothetical protein